MRQRMCVKYLCRGKARNFVKKQCVYAGEESEVIKEHKEMIFCWKKKITGLRGVILNHE